MKNKKISIIMPTFNSEKTVIDSINSVLNQSYSNWELLIIDDNSTDSTLQIIEEYKKRYSKINLIKKNKNIGVSHSRNIGIEKTDAPYIAFLDSDDIWDKDKLLKQVQLLENGCELCFTGVKYIRGDGSSLSGVFEVPREITYEKLLWNNVISTSSVMLKRNIIGDTRMLNYDFHEDFHFWLELCKKKIRCEGINEQLLIYRFSKNTKSSNKVKSFMMTYKVYRELGINSISSSIFTISHLFHAAIKYKKIFASR